MSQLNHQKVEIFCLLNRLLFEVGYYSRWALFRDCTVDPNLFYLDLDPPVDDHDDDDIGNRNKQVK